MSLRSVLFDVDGTLADTEALGHRPAYNRAFRKLGLQMRWGPKLYRRLLRLPGGRAFACSGSYRRGFTVDGRRFSHLIDPRSGEPARGLQAVTVVAASGALADAASTAIFVAGPQHWREAARALGVDQVFIVDAGGRIEITEALAHRVC